MSAPGREREEEKIIRGVFLRKKSKQSVTVKTRFLQLSLGPKESCENLVFTMTNCFDFFRRKTPGMIFSSSQALPGADVGAFLPLGWRGGFLRGSSEAAPSEGRQKHAAGTARTFVRVLRTKKQHDKHFVSG